jgi:hypothetical protein
MLSLSKHHAHSSDADVDREQCFDKLSMSGVGFGLIAG